LTSEKWRGYSAGHVSAEHRGRPPQLRGAGSSDFQTAFAAHDRDTEWRTAADEPDRQTYRGMDGLRRLVRSVAEPWEDRFKRSVELKSFIAYGDWVVVPWRARLHGRGAGSRSRFFETYAVLLRDDKIVRVEEYRTLEQALEAVRSRA
jgi:ketosteroid isomerase-like protein